LTVESYLETGDFELPLASVSKRVSLWSQLYENAFHLRMKGFARELILEQKRKVIQRGFVFGLTTV